MSSSYTGNASNNPTSITIPSDGDGPGIKAADVDPAFEGLMDRAAYTQKNMTLKSAVFTASGTWTVPVGCTNAIAIGCGGGGGGGCAANATGYPAGAGFTYAGGGGGAGAPLSIHHLSGLTDGYAAAVTIGAGGAGVAPTVAGNDGASSSIVTPSGTAVFPGGQCGASTGSGAIAAGTLNLCQGGSAPSGSALPAVITGLSLAGSGTTGIKLTPLPGAGGDSSLGATGGSEGCASSKGYAGGAKGTGGGVSGSTLGGSAGGGGGGGPFGVGGAAGNAGNGVNPGTGTAATAAGSAAANTGAGGGGGATGGAGSVAGGASANSGSGGSGKIIILYVAPE